MTTLSAVLGIVGSLLLVILGVIKSIDRKKKFRREESEKAKEDLNNANKNNSPSDFLDGFGRM